MAHLVLDPALLSSLSDKVVVLTGGATGIGRSAVTFFHQNGAKVVFGDIAHDSAQEVISSLGKENIHFVPCDTTSYASQLNLFRTAHSLYGRIDIVAAIAGVANPKSIFDPDSDINEEPTMLEINVNTIGSLFTARIGMHYLRQNKDGGDLVLMSSIIGFKETQDLVPYTTSKHGVVGIMRGLHLQAQKEGIRVNVVCPWVTRTRMIVGMQKGWIENGFPLNESEDVARQIVICATANRGTNGATHTGAKLPFSGKMIYVSGGEGYEIEDEHKALEPQWLGEENSRVLALGQEFMARPEFTWDPERSN
ncbi:hypothetical protein ASPSYDRAFT_159940 [Aspergillus sydowii CBS 593.65]|uniref:Uncharacterized protein n=1 Tax=Aspergillus sydowii CBS 593.65 TaxID=1036612 RepID=A0A1L9T520_9EURO|nr:uncharacterized protein ASPSYDRAFT_159940 [Aspergillus sydowii CBS 593.65]OJJ54507.1 hypothetical protein ASPSYDRAFT_159940 [Aspergillus sydowii CBS 593.65]